MEVYRIFVIYQNLHWEKNLDHYLYRLIALDSRFKVQIVRFNQCDLLQCQNQNKSGCFLLVQMTFSCENSYVGNLMLEPT